MLKFFCINIKKISAATRKFNITGCPYLKAEDNTENLNEFYVKHGDMNLQSR